MHFVTSKHICRYADLNGLNRHVLPISPDYVSQPYGVSVFENFVYWSDWNYKTITRADKWTGSNAQTLLTNLPIQPYDIKIVHPLHDRYGETILRIRSIDCNQFW